MPTDYSYTEVKDADGNLLEIQFMPSTLETIDRALHDFIDKELNLHVNTNKGWSKVPTIWVSAERAFQIKNNKNLRDSSGVLKLPLATIERTSVVKDPTFKGTITLGGSMSQQPEGLTKRSLQTLKMPGRQENMELTITLATGRSTSPAPPLIRAGSSLKQFTSPSLFM